jgi:peptide-methionine (S)-S-oxide reductase
MEKATFANGCFWCTEAIFKRLKGVISVTSGYTGGTMDDPSYSIVSTGQTGHAEAVQVEFDPKVISYQTLLDVFFATHNPTTLNQQGADIGTQYRSVIFFHTEEQKDAAKDAIKLITESKKYTNPVVTEVVPFEKFFSAEGYHQNYYDANPTYPYCTVVIDPKIRKLLKEFSQDIKDEYKNV